MPSQDSSRRTLSNPKEDELDKMRRDAMHARGAADPHRSAAHLTSLTALEARVRGDTSCVRNYTGRPL